ncbi:uncharacterized protein LOC132559090 [Ylistrum balloti]|uniref:uncharacterized protein LOC132559090 n=1 Tax=Ylistrum balloti TaxID=509963 RepID=UPI002905C42E|nr:uncharacterized protein LOC132559090 [Ylistrum balloti]
MIDTFKKVMSVKWNLCKRRLWMDSPLFEEGNTMCYSPSKHLLVVDEEASSSEGNQQFSCQLANCGRKFNSHASYENHYGLVHSRVCQTCHKSFPTNHLLDLHILEWHDTMFALQTKKEPMFNCLVESCKCKFSTRKERKNHVVKNHKYPSNYRFDRNPSKHGHKDDQSLKEQFTRIQFDTSSGVEGVNRMDVKDTLSGVEGVNRMDVKDTSSGVEGVNRMDVKDTSSGVEGVNRMDVKDTSSGVEGVNRMDVKDTLSGVEGVNRMDVKDTSSGVEGVNRMDVKDTSSGVEGVNRMDVKNTAPQRRQFSYKVPLSICFGQGTSRGFQRSRERGHVYKKGQHWYNRCSEKMDTHVDIEKVDLQDLKEALT